jgi:sugar phosphate isomerase/epimerase
MNSPAITRREFVASFVAAATIPPLSSFASVPGVDVGLELYSLRAGMKTDVPGTLSRVRQMGFRHVEVPAFYGLSAAQFRRALDAVGLKATALVAPYDDLQKDIEKVQHDLATLGARWAILPWIPHGDRFERADVERSSKDMNAWAATLSASGFRFAYHPHGYEFYPAPEGTLFDLLAASTDSGTVKFQLDTFWIVWPGQDCVKLMRRYPGRFRLLHLKDLRKGVPTGDLHGTAPEAYSVALGEGVVPFREILTLAKQQGCERYYIEDESSDAAAQIPRSLRFLAALHF